MNPHLIQLSIIFAFVIVLVVIRRYFQWQRNKLWHETARLALEKGQPLPDAAPLNQEHWTVGGRWDLRRGLVLIAVGAALYFAMPVDVHMYGAIPAFIGVALILFWLFGSLRPENYDNRKDQPGSK